MERYLHSQTPHRRPYLVPTSKILIPPSKSDKMRRRLVGRQVCRLRGGRGGLPPRPWLHLANGEGRCPPPCGPNTEQ